MSDGNRSANWEQRFNELQARYDELKRNLADALEKLAKATKTSSNSSKLPSSDIVKPIRPRRPAGERKKGGQKGHKRIVRRGAVGLVAGNSMGFQADLDFRLI